MTDRPSTAFRLPRGLLDRLNQEARERVVSRNLIVEVAIERFLAPQGKPDIADCMDPWCCCIHDAKDLNTTGAS